MIVSIISSFKQHGKLDRDAIEDFRELPFFGNIVRRYGHDALESVLKHVRIVNFKAGDTIIKEGDIADGIYIFLRGQGVIEAIQNCIQPFNHSINQPEKIFGVGDVVGEFGFYSRSQRRTATIKAVDDCQLGFLNKDQVVQTIDNQMSS